MPHISKPKMGNQNPVATMHNISMSGNLNSTTFTNPTTYAYVNNTTTAAATPTTTFNYGSLATGMIYTTLGGANGTVGTVGVRSRPATWKEIKIKPSSFNSEGLYENPACGSMVWIGSIVIENSMGHYHWSLFKKEFPDINYLLVGIPGIDCSQTVVSNVMFLNADDFNTFETWFEKHIKWFGGKENLYSYRYPPPPQTMPKSYQMKMAQHDDDTDLHFWILQNCIDKVYLLADTLFFLSEEDAVAYRLKFE